MLQTMAAELGITIVQQAALAPELPGAVAEGEGLEAPEYVEAARRGLEDLFNLY